MNVFRVSDALGKWMACAASATFLALASSGAAQAVPVRVDYGATLAPSAVSAGAGVGTISGTLGVFDNPIAGGLALLNNDGTFSVDIAGFVDGFPNGSFPLTNLNGPPFGLSFLTVGPTAADFSAAFAGTPDVSFLGTGAIPCLIGGSNTSCFVRMVARAGNAGEAFALYNGPGDAPPFSLGPIEFSFTVLDEPTDLSLPNAFLLLASILVVFGALRMKSQG